MDLCFFMFFSMSVYFVKNQAYRIYRVYCLREEGKKKKVRGPRWSKWATLVNSSRSGMLRVIRHEQNELYLILSGVAKNLRGRVDSCFRAVSHAVEFLYPTFVPYPSALAKHSADVASQSIFVSLRPHSLSRPSHSYYESPSSPPPTLSHSHLPFPPRFCITIRETAT
jgi:hypothetical protein